MAGRRGAPLGLATEEEPLVVERGEVLLSYVDGRYLWLNEAGYATAAAVGHPDPLGMSIFDVAPDLRATAFGQCLTDVLNGGPASAVCEGMEVIFPGARLSAKIEPRDNGVFVRFWLAPVNTPLPARLRRNGAP